MKKKNDRWQTVDKDLDTAMMKIRQLQALTRTLELFDSAEEIELDPKEIGHTAGLIADQLDEIQVCVGRTEDLLMALRKN